jgi:hypothetical protein
MPLLAIRAGVCLAGNRADKLNKSRNLGFFDHHTNTTPALNEPSLVRAVTTSQHLKKRRFPHGIGAPLAPQMSSFS